MFWLKGFRWVPTTHQGINRSCSGVSGFPQYARTTNQVKKKELLLLRKGWRVCSHNLLNQQLGFEEMLNHKPTDSVFM